MVTYSDFRPGYTFAEIRAELRREQDLAWANEGRRMSVTRHTVLGRWRQRKLEAWDSLPGDVKELEAWD